MSAKRAKRTSKTQLTLSFQARKPAAGAKRTQTRAKRMRTAAPTARPTAAVDHRTAEALARQQREISVSEFFAKNRHLLGFDNKRKALLTSVKEMVDNSLDACEEAGVLPEIEVTVKPCGEDRFRVVVRDNGPGIVKQQIPNIFGKLLYGSKFHRLKMSRGQQGIGVSAAGMYGLLTTGKPIRIISRTDPRREAHHYEIAIDTHKNRPEVVLDETIETDMPHGTQVEIELQATYSKGRQSVDEYLEQTAIANPHARIVYHSPTGECVEFARGTDHLPPQPRQIKPHPYGIELGLLLKMLKDTRCTKLGAFLKQEFSRVTSRIAKQIAEKAGLSPKTWIKQIGPRQAEAIYQAIQTTRIMAPPTDCLAPIGVQQILAGLLKEVKAEFFTAATRSPSVYRGNPFQIEVGLAYGGNLPSEEPAKILRFANRVPLLYQQSHCTIFKSVTETNWRAYGLQQSRGALPVGPLVIMVHMASVWVPFTSESKEAIADYDEIRKEIKLALQECGRKLAAYLKRRQRQRREGERRSAFLRYIDEVVNAVHTIKPTDKERLRRRLSAIARRRTAEADVELDESGKPIRKKTPDEADMLGEDTVIVRRDEDADGEPGLFGPQAAADQPAARAGQTHRASATKRTRRRAS